MYTAKMHVNRGVSPVSFEQECCNYGFFILYRKFPRFLAFLTPIEATKGNFCGKDCTVQPKTVKRKCVVTSFLVLGGVHSFKDA